MRILDPAPARAILIRMLRNLYGAHAAREEWDRAARSADRVLRLSPRQPEALRDRGLAYLKLDHVGGARDDLARYLQLRPDAGDAAALRETLIGLNTLRPRRH